MKSMDSKRLHGQFFTTGNPFVLEPFHRWMTKVALDPEERVLEPFCGANHLVRLMCQAGYDLQWSCHDLHPPSAQLEGVKIQRRDSFANFPKGHRLAITNPPYLARNSATRRGLPFPITEFDDVYKHALDIALQHVAYLGAIIPESFLTAGELTSRLECVVSLPWAMFDDTEHPVCLALFSPQATSDFEVFCGNERLGKHSSLAGFLESLPAMDVGWKFNDPKGSIGIRAVDNQKAPSIAFVPGAEIDSEHIKPTSRALTRVSGLPKGMVESEVIAAANELLAQYRSHTRDVLLTPFKGLRDDGRYRRRLDFGTSRALLSASVAKVMCR